MPLEFVEVSNKTIIKINPHSRDSLSFYNGKMVNYLPMNSTITLFVDTKIMEFTGKQFFL